MTAALVRSMNNDLLDKLVYDIRCQLSNMLILEAGLNTVVTV
jgi:hypothetical protein